MQLYTEFGRIRGMKEKTVRKINRLGHFSQVIALIMKILVILMLLFLVAATVISFGLPDEALEVTVSSNADISTDFGFTGRTISASDQQALLSGKGDVSSDLLGKDGSLNDWLKQNGGKIEYKKVSDHFINAVVSNAGSRTIKMNDVRYGLLAGAIQTALFLIALFVASSLCKALRYCESPFEKGVIRRLRGFGFALLFWSLAATCSEAVPKYFSTDDNSLDVKVHLGLLFMALIVLALTRIFKYGAILHRELEDALPAEEVYGDFEDAAEDSAFADYPDDEEFYETLPAEEGTDLSSLDEGNLYQEEDAGPGEENVEADLAETTVIDSAAVADAEEPADIEGTYEALKLENGEDL